MNQTKEPKSVETEHNGDEVDYENRNKSASTNDSTNEEQIPEAAKMCWWKKVQIISTFQTPKEAMCFAKIYC